MSNDPKREPVAQNDDLIAVPREVLAAANYIIRKSRQAETQTGIEMRKYALGPAILAKADAIIALTPADAGMREAIRMAYKAGYNEAYSDATDGMVDRDAAEEGWQQYLEALTAAPPATDGGTYTVSASVYERAVKGRQDFRKAYRNLLPVLRAAETISKMWRTKGQKLDDEFFDAINAVDVAVTGGGAKPDPEWLNRAPVEAPSPVEALREATVAEAIYQAARKSAGADDADECKDDYDQSALNWVRNRKDSLARAALAALTPADAGSGGEG